MCGGCFKTFEALGNLFVTFIGNLHYSEGNRLKIKHVKGLEFRSRRKSCVAVFGKTSERALMISDRTDC